MSSSLQQFSEPHGHSRSSIHGMVLHLMDAEDTWFSRLHGQSPRGNPSTADYPTRVAIRARWDEVEHNARAYLATLTDDALSQIVSYRHKDGTSQSDPLWAILLHVVNHGTDHRATLLQWRNELGFVTPERDLIYYIRSPQAAS